MFYKCIFILLGCAPVVALAQQTLDDKGANKLVELPLHCVNTEFPNKLGQVLGSAEDLGTPLELHPAFYGCFDWHSSVHGHWSLVRLINQFPNLEQKKRAIKLLQEHLTKENIEAEVDYFTSPHNGTYERMYGWAWLFQLTLELQNSSDHNLKKLLPNVLPLTKVLSNNVKEFLPKLQYPIRVGTHTNTAFAMCMIYDYAEKFDDFELKQVIVQRAKDFYENDNNCPISWEPSGYDFLSPCLEEANLMRRILPKREFKKWLEVFLPNLLDEKFQLNPGIVGDRTDGHLVHLDGLNFSRAWCLYGIARALPELDHLIPIADNHIEYSLPNLVGDSYEGGHWLASFALLALTGK